MANTYRVTHAFQGNGGTTQDEYVNQFYFFSGYGPGTVATDWGPLLAATVHQLWALGGNPPSLSLWYHPRCLGNLGVTKIYDVTDPSVPAGAPIFQISDSTLIPNDDYLPDCDATYVPLPEEVALCLSYQAIHTDGDLPRRRGRIYLGPLNTLAIDDTNPTGPSRPVAGLINRVLANAVAMQHAADDLGFEWRVFSKMDAFAFKIVNFSVDDSFDTVRGRGTAPAARVTVPIM